MAFVIKKMLLIIKHFNICIIFLEEKMSFGAEYDTSEAGNSPPPPLPTTPPPYMIETKENELKNSIDKTLNNNKLLIPELIEKATGKEFT